MTLARHCGHQISPETVKVPYWIPHSVEFEKRVHKPRGGLNDSKQQKPTDRGPGEVDP